MLSPVFTLYQDRRFVCFAGPHSDNGYLSNWYESPFSMDSHDFENSEQAFLYLKALRSGDEATAMRVFAMVDHAYFVRLSKQIRPFDARRWAGRREATMRQVVHEKFLQNADLCDALLATDDATIVSCTGNVLWSCGLALDQPHRLDPDAWVGQNLLGTILMDLREELRPPHLEPAVKVEAPKTTKTTEAPAVQEDHADVTPEATGPQAAADEPDKAPDDAAPVPTVTAPDTEESPEPAVPTESEGPIPAADQGGAVAEEPAEDVRTPDTSADNHTDAPAAEDMTTAATDEAEDSPADDTTGPLPQELVAESDESDTPTGPLPTVPSTVADEAQASLDDLDDLDEPEVAMDAAPQPRDTPIRVPEIADATAVTSPITDAAGQEGTQDEAPASDEDTPTASGDSDATDPIVRRYEDGRLPLPSELADGLVLKHLMGLFAQEGTTETRDALMQCLRDSMVVVPADEVDDSTTPGTDDATGGTLIIDSDKAYRPNILENARGDHWLPAFTSPDEVNPQVRDRATLLTLPLTQCIDVARSHGGLSGIVVNVFSENLILPGRTCDYIAKLPSGAKE